MTLECPVGAPHLSGDVAALVVLDPGLPPTTIIKMSDPFNVQVEWHIEGGLVPMLGGNWHINVFCESIGKGFEGQLGAEKVVALGDGALTNPPPKRAYSTLIDVPAAETIADFEPGAYKLTAVITYENGGVPGEMAGYSEGPILQFYKV